MLTNLVIPRADFEAATQTEPATQYLADVYRTGIMFERSGEQILLNDSSIGLTEGQILWYLARSSHSKSVIETGFGRGGSAAFFLSALAPWNGTLVSIDHAFRHWAGDTGIHYINQLGLAENHRLIEEPSELALAKIVSKSSAEYLSLSYIDGSHHFDGTLIDFMHLDRLTEIGGIIAIDDAHAPAVRTVASFVANNLPYNLHYPTQRLLLCKKFAHDERDWSHFRPFTSSPKADWDVHDDQANVVAVPGATFGHLPK